MNYLKSSSSQVSTDSVNRTFTALIICEKGNEEAAGPGPENRAFTHLHNTSLFIPEGQSRTPHLNTFYCLPYTQKYQFLFLVGPCSHTVQKLKPQDISSITVKTLKVIPERIIDNYNKRQQPRFRWTSISLASTKNDFVLPDP